MQVVVWIIILLVIVFFVWLLRKWIKRLIFILILLALAFLIYGIFNPSGAARIWYNVRTFPQRMASWMGSAEQFLDYDSYKSGLSSIGDKIGDEFGDDRVDLIDDEDESNLEIDDVEFGGDEDEMMKNYVTSDTEEIGEVSEHEDKRAIKAFSRSIKFVDFSQLMERNISSDDRKVSGYSKSDLLGVIGKYIEENLDDDTDILVTVEYEDNGTKPQRVILETRPRTLGEKQTIYFSSKFLEESGTELEGENNDIVGDSVNSATEKTNVSKGSKSVQRNTSNKLTQKDQNEAEEIFSILF